MIRRPDFRRALVLLPISLVVLGVAAFFFKTKPSTATKGAATSAKSRGKS